MMSVSFKKKYTVASEGNLFPLTMILKFKLVSIVEKIVSEREHLGWENVFYSVQDDYRQSQKHMFLFALAIERRLGW